jgi:hypothetical protein
MAKAKGSIASVSSQVYGLLEPFEKDERLRIVNGVLTLLGEGTVSSPSRGSGSGTGSGGGGAASVGGGAGASGGDVHQVADVRKGARAYFDLKRPQGKSEELATAARFHELTKDGAAATKADLERIISTEARRGFRTSNFPRDIENARGAKLFNPGGSSTGGYTLSYVGQNFVDALPDRKAAKAFKKETRGAPRKGKKKKRAKQAAAK